VFHYQPLHLSEMGRKYGGHAGQLPVTERLGDCLVRLPMYNDMQPQEQLEVIKALRTFKLD